MFSINGLGRATIPARILVPGANRMSIYGHHLGPQAGCIGSPDKTQREAPNPRQTDTSNTDNLVYPLTLCGVQVLIGQVPAGLLYVSETQINFKVPLNIAETASADLRVVYQGQSSDAVPVPVGFEHTTIELAQPAYAGSPVWLKVNLPYPMVVTYPATEGPAHFGCDQVEVRRNGVALSPLPASNQALLAETGLGSPCGSPGLVYQSSNRGRLPLHMLYRFDQPGIYEVRYTRTKPMLYQSEWTPIEILPARPEQRAQRLADFQDHPPTDPAEILTDTLPNLLGLPDPLSLQILTGYLYHPDRTVRRYAAYGLYYWPAQEVTRVLKNLVASNGSTDVIDRYLAASTRKSR